MTQNRIMVVLIPFSRNILVSSLESLLFEGGNPVAVQEETTVNFVSLRQILSRKVCIKYTSPYTGVFNVKIIKIYLHR